MLLIAKKHRLNMDLSLNITEIFRMVNEKNEERLRQCAELGLLTIRLMNGRCTFGNQKVKIYYATPLLLACALGYTNIAEILLEHGACVNGRNEWGESPLWIASEEGYLDVVKLLLNHN